jgi:hypothetical protein
MQYRWIHAMRERAGIDVRLYPGPRRDVHVFRVRVGVVRVRLEKGLKEEGRKEKKGIKKIGIR